MNMQGMLLYFVLSFLPSQLFVRMDVPWYFNMLGCVLIIFGMQLTFPSRWKPFKEDKK